MTTLAGLGEAGLIARWQRRLERPARDVVRGIGDDAAVLRLPAGQAGAPGGGRLLLTSDMLVEGVHFRRGRTPAHRIGWKALACSVSDIAAMGGVPRWAVVSAGLPRGTTVAFADGLARGLRRCADRFGVRLVGGDTVRAPRVVLDVALVGTAPRGRFVPREGARVGDWLFVTGRLGGAVRSGRHAAFTPRLREAHALSRRVRLRALMDCSDGLAADARQLSRASHVVWRLDAARIPVARGATLRGALHDGEDFELLFAVRPGEAARVPRRVGACPVTPVGRAVRRGVGVELAVRGRVRALRPQGFRHF